MGDSRRWGSLTMVPTGNKAKRLSSVNHTTKTIHYHSSLSELVEIAVASVISFWYHFNFLFAMDMLPIYLLFFWFLMKVLHSLFEIPFSKDSYHIETSIPIYIANQLPSFHMTQSLLRGISEQTLSSNKYYAKYIYMTFRFSNIILW